MKFIYVDESGGRDQSDVFVMCGLMVDAYSLRKKTADSDQRLKNLFKRYPGNRTDLKTSRFINGKREWQNIDPQERKDFLTELCEMAVHNSGKIFGIALSFSAFDKALAGAYQPPTQYSYWHAAATFTSCLVQKKMQMEKGGKGLTVMIVDDNRKAMPDLSEALYDSDTWFDGLYQVRKQKYKKSVWVSRTEGNRFDQIINTAFAIKSDHSSLIQVADAICYVYRRHLELKTDGEKWPGEKKYYEKLVGLLESKRVKNCQYPNEPCVQFFKQAKHPDWKL